MRVVLSLLAALALALGLAGCGDSGGDSAAGAGGSAATGGSYVDWPLFGRVPARTHYLPAEEKALDPPLNEAWSVNTHALIEFPPAIHDGVAYVVNKYGNGKAVRLQDRKVLWEINVRPSDKGKPNFVTAPVYYRGAVYEAFLTGNLAAGDAKTGKKLWVRNQSSMFALDAKSGKPVWRSNTSKVPPYGRGGFFSSPAVAFGSVYAARDDGTVYAFDERSGKVAWHFDAGGQVYGSPAVAQVPGTPPTVYIGAENGRFFALDARTGKVRWQRDVGGPIPGTATVIGHTVYTSSFKTEETSGFDVRTHKRTFHMKESGYTPMVSDGKRLYLIGYYDLVGLKPK